MQVAGLVALLAADAIAMGVIIVAGVVTVKVTWTLTRWLWTH